MRMRECAKFRGYFVGPKYFLVSISWVSYFFSWVFRGSNFFSRGYIMDPRFYGFQYILVKNKNKLMIEEF